jgi:hypothetical protein
VVDYPQQQQQQLTAFKVPHGPPFQFKGGPGGGGKVASVADNPSSRQLTAFKVPHGTAIKFKQGTRHAGGSS